MIQGGFLAYLLIRLSGADREVMEKWLYVIVGLIFIAGILGTAHHYYWVGVPRYWLPIGGIFSALEPLALPRAWRSTPTRRCDAPASRTRTRWRCTGRSGSAVFTLFGAGLLGLAHTWPAVNKWTHGTLITAMHGHTAFFGAYVMIVLAMITYALPADRRAGRPSRARSSGYWAFWLQIGGMFGMTMAFATAGIGQVYLERILGLGYLDTQLKIQVHFLMLLATGIDLRRRRGAVHLRLLPPRAALRACDRRARAAARRGRDGRRCRAGDALAREPHGSRPPDDEPYYLPAGDEVAVFEQCHARGLAVMLKGPTGCGKTRFVEHMAWRLEPAAGHGRLPRRPHRERPHRPLPDPRTTTRCGRTGR